ncbi:hypothetical protein [Actinomyces sp. W5033]|uniref:hypothetical protein n=1 Tax=Actinomyces sp. W5033 TaxID=3446479 RepID=UPI003EE1628A
MQAQSTDAATAEAHGGPAAGAPSRLDTARAALAQAEARTGLRAPLPLGAWPGAAVAVSASTPGALAAGTLPAPVPGPPGRAPGSESPWEAVNPAAAGVLSLTGSVTLLLAAAARRQGPRGWCAVVGGRDLGWCAAAEAGLDLSRVLVVPARDLAPAVLPSVVAALVDGLDVVLLTDATARALTARQQRAVAARARERGCLVLLDEPWEGARLLRARARGLGTQLVEADQEGGEGAADVPQSGGARVLALRPAPRGPLPEGLAPCPPRPTPPAPPTQPLAQEPAQAPVEMPAGWLRHLDWVLTEPQRGPATVLVRSGARGVEILEDRAPQEPRRRAPALTVLPGGLS